MLAVCVQAVLAVCAHAVLAVCAHAVLAVCAHAVLAVCVHAVLAVRGQYALISQTPVSMSRAQPSAIRRTLCGRFATSKMRWQCTGRRWRYMQQCWEKTI